MQAVPELKTILQAERGAKVLVVPSSQAGQKVLANWARSGIPTFGLRTCTPIELAEWVLETAFPDKAVPRLPDLNQILALDEVLGGFDFRKLEALGWSGERLSRSIRMMRVSGIGADEYLKGSDGKLAKEVAGVLDAYVKWLYKNGVSDEAERFTRADMALSRVQVPSLLLVLGETPLSESGAQFLAEMATKADRSVVLEGDDAGGNRTQAGTAARVLSDWDRARLPLPGSATVDLVRIPFLEDEAGFVMEELERREIALDRAEVAYPRHTPYLPLLLGEAARRGIPVTSAAGTPLSDLPVGQALRLLLSWLAGGKDSLDLVRMLRSGFVRLPDASSAGSVVSHLIQFHAVGDWKNYQKGFAGLKPALEADVAATEGTDGHSRARARLKRLKESERAVDRLFEVVPGQQATVRRFAGLLRRFIEMFVIDTDGPGTIPSKGRSEIISRLDQIEEGPDSEHASDHLVARFAQWLNTLIVHARLDAPGTLHISPLDSAGLAGRPHLFVLGLDSTNFLPSPVEDVFLPDSFCEAWGRASGPLTSEERVEARRMALRRAMARTSDSVSVVVSGGRLADGGDAGPASMFLELESEFGSAREGHLPLGFGPTRQIITQRGSAVADALLLRHFPASANARKATIRRSHSAFTEYDAFVGARELIGQSLQGPWSPSRLQELATCPFLYFQGRVLGVPPLEERKRGEWMTALENGRLVHDALNAFNVNVMAGTCQPTDTAALFKLLKEEFKTFRKANEPPSEFVWRARLRELARIAKVATLETRQVLMSEVGFGQPPHRALNEDDNQGDFELALGSTRILLRGRIDVVERTDRGLVITDYKTGRSDAYSESDLLDGGKRLQWVLYAYAFEDLKGEAVDESGYLFVSGDAAGQTAYGKPLRREDVGELLGGLLGLAEQGHFPPSADPGRGTSCTWCDYKRVCGDLGRRRDEIRMKLDCLVESDGQDESGIHQILDTWPYARKYLKR